ncbi:MAG: vanadium-dependent haloperoxidase [Parvularculaceae bacterium]
MKLTNKLLATTLLATLVMPAAASAAPTDTLLRWHEIMLQANADDHTPGVGVFEQGGPVRNSRAFAMTQTAVYDAVNAFALGFNPYNDIGSAPAGASQDAAIACAAHGVLAVVYSSLQPTFDNALAADLAALGASASVNDGCALGEASAAAMLARRVGDGSEVGEAAPGTSIGVTATGTTNWFGERVNGPLNGLPFRWSPDPIGQQPVALGASWGAVTPFALTNGAQFRIPAPPRPGTRDYVGGWNQVAQLGGSPSNTGIVSTSTPAARFIGNYWGYDGQALLGTPPRLYAQIAVQVALEQGLTDTDELARYLALIHVVMGDAGIAAWDSKYFYNYWRPSTGVRADDGVANTPSDPNWQAVGISIANSTGAALRITPPFPAYPSGHATFGAATVQVMKAFFGNNTATTFVSDEYDGVSTDPFTPGVPRPLVPVRFRRLDHQASENGISRIFNGVHWNWDNTAGQRLGRNVSDWLLNSIEPFQPRSNTPE